MKKTCTIFVFGNPDLDEDSLVIDLLPELKKRFPQINFCHLDPNEDWFAPNASVGVHHKLLPENLIILDTVKNLKKVSIFKNLKNFEKTRSLTLHDFDALTNLLWLKKLKKLKNLTIIGIPADLKKEKALKEIERAFSAKL